MFGRPAVDHSIQQFDEALSRLGPDCSAPLISALTEIARHFANPHLIVLLVELRTLSNPIDLKLPVIYLMDSIMKLAGRVYTELFRQNILVLFPSTYAMVEGPVINSMIKVFTLWKEQGILPTDILLQIEGVMTRTDQHRQLFLSGVPFPSRWPKTIHGEKNLQETLELCIVKDLYLRLLSPHHVLPSNDQLKYQQEHIVRQIVLQQKLRAELGLLPDPEVPRLLELYRTVQQVKDASLSNGGFTANLIPPPMNERQPPAYPYTGRLRNQPNSVSKNAKSMRASGNKKETDKNNAPFDQPEPSFSNIASLQHFNKRAVQNLYSNLPEQCRQCGMRFANKNQLDDHLGMHLKLNKHRLSKSVSTRNWYLSLEDWLDTKGGTHMQNSTVLPSTAVTRAKHASDSTNEEVASKQRTTADDSQKICAGCGEVLEVEWDKQEELWFNYDAVRSESDSKIYHVKCCSRGDTTQNNQIVAAGSGFGNSTMIMTPGITPASVGQILLSSPTLGSHMVTAHRAGDGPGSTCDNSNNHDANSTTSEHHLGGTKRPAEGPDHQLDVDNISGDSPKRFKSGD